VGWFTPPTPGGPLSDKCTKSAAANVWKLIACIGKCTSKDVTAEDGTFDASACAAKCRAKYDASAAKLLAKGGCPPCLSEMEQSSLANQATTSITGMKGRLYCAVDGPSRCDFDPQAPECSVCGNDVAEPPRETCDGADDAPCPGACTAACTCPIEE
jgi:hypothetical protein